MNRFPEEKFLTVDSKHYRRLKLRQMGGGFFVYVPRYLLYGLANERGLVDVIELGVSEEGTRPYELIGIGVEDFEKEDSNAAAAQ